jgi:hypothetical protein
MSEDRKFGPAHRLVSRDELLGENGPLHQVLNALKIPGASAARRLNTAKGNVIARQDLPEDVVASVIKAMDDPKDTDIGEGNWNGFASEVLEAIEDYLLDLKTKYTEAKSEKKAEEKKE